MDERLGAWARAVKARRARAGIITPVLWLFTDANRMPNPLPAIQALPRGLCGVVFRHDDVPERARLGRQIAAICRERHLLLTIAGDPRLAASLQAGVHLRAGRPAGLARVRAGPVTASAHNLVDIRRAARRGAAAIFLSPVFPSASHPGAPSLGSIRFAALCRHTGHVFALGGIDGASAARLPRRLIAGAGAIAALGVGNAPR